MLINILILPYYSGVSNCSLWYFYILALIIFFYIYIWGNMGHSRTITVQIKKNIMDNSLFSNLSCLQESWLFFYAILRDRFLKCLLLCISLQYKLSPHWVSTLSECRYNFNKAEISVDISFHIYFHTTDHFNLFL